MARRAQQGAVARCPWCSASLSQLAVECPECRFPLTMAAADGGYVAEPSGTTSTATPGRAPGGQRPGLHHESELARAHGTRAHRIRLGALLLGVMALLLLLSGVGAIVSTSSPDARSDREATSSLFTALRRATVDPGYRQAVAIATLPADQPSDRPSRVSADQAGGYWFATAHSSSGRCYVLVGRLADGKLVRTSNLSEDEPCTGSRARSSLDGKLANGDGS